MNNQPNTHNTCPQCSHLWSLVEINKQICDGCGFPTVKAPATIMKREDWQKPELILIDKPMPGTYGKQVPSGYSETQQWDRLMDDDMYD